MSLVCSLAPLVGAELTEAFLRCSLPLPLFVGDVEALIRFARLLQPQLSSAVEADLRSAASRSWLATYALVALLDVSVSLPTFSSLELARTTQDSNKSQSGIQTRCDDSCWLAAFPSLPGSELALLLHGCVPPNFVGQTEAERRCSSAGAAAAAATATATATESAAATQLIADRQARMPAPQTVSENKQFCFVVLDFLFVGRCWAQSRCSRALRCARRCRRCCREKKAFAPPEREKRR